MKQSTLRFIFAVIFGVMGVIAWILWNHRDQTSHSVSDLPDLPSELAAAPIVEVVVPASLSETEATGERAFATFCAACHGTNAAGREDIAPPLVHRIYHPGHHSDEAFHIAVLNGVRAHHWRFGNMPSIKGVTRAEVNTIIAYVRALQRANGIE
ncbi:c-type cytochrome [Blastomonas fulva]|uniref:c-type cytochrome n=1 Tax=Blastomonas fulva TaxID=1550728 RepID=UPI003D2AD502